MAKIQTIEREPRSSRSLKKWQPHGNRIYVHEDTFMGEVRQSSHWFAKCFFSVFVRKKREWRKLKRMATNASQKVAVHSKSGNPPGKTFSDSPSHSNEKEDVCLLILLELVREHLQSPSRCLCYCCCCSCAKKQDTLTYSIYPYTAHGLTQFHFI
jgi:hypothetical protein